MRMPFLCSGPIVNDERSDPTPSERTRVHGKGHKPESRWLQGQTGKKDVLGLKDFLVGQPDGQVMLLKRACLWFVTVNDAEKV